MRWRRRQRREPAEGDERAVTRFALWPVRVDDEIIWLERYVARQRRVWRMNNGSLDYGHHLAWQTVERIPRRLPEATARRLSS